MAAQISRWLITGTLLGSLFHYPVFADQVADDQAPVLPEATHVTQEANAKVNEFFGRVAINSDVLESNRGGAELQVLNKNTLDGVVSDNQAYNLSTGSNWITSGSFANASGQSTVIQNSGNNVLIQNATIINLQVQ